MSEIIDLTGANTLPKRGEALSGLFAREPPSRGGMLRSWYTFLFAKKYVSTDGVWLIK